MSNIKTKSQIINDLIDYYSNGNKSDFARKLGITPQGINSWLSRESFDAELIYAKCDDISAAWLLTGKGEMLKENEKFSNFFLGENVYPECQYRMSTQISKMSTQNVSPATKKGIRNWTPDIACNFTEGEISDQEQIADLNLFIKGLQRVIDQKKEQLTAKEELLKAKDETIATQKEALRLVENQINATTSLIEKMTEYLGNV